MRSILFAIICLVGSEVAAADLITAMRAYNDGRYDIALDNFRQLAAQADPQAEYHLGIMYDYGWGVDLDDETAVGWYTRAAAQGVFFAQYNLGVMYAEGEGVEQDLIRAHMWTNIAASSGSPSASTIRRNLESQMTDSQIATAMQSGRNCLQTNFANCE
jgi:hypothetical protein